MRSYKNAESYGGQVKHMEKESQGSEIRSVNINISLANLIYGQVGVSRLPYQYQL
jgi:hypothetical protein